MPSPGYPTISVLIPIYNEYESIPFLVAGLNEFFELQNGLNAEVLFINDGSADHSLELLKEMEHRFYEARIISLSQNYGSHAALRAGILHARGEFITFTYADLQDPLENITRMHERTKEGFDIVWANRSSTQNSYFEKKFSKFYSYLMRKFVNHGYPNKGFDIVLFNKKVLDIVNTNIENNSSIFLQILNMGFRQDFIEYQKIPRKAGKSKWTLSKKVKLLIDSFVAFSYAPIRLVSYTGILFFIGGLLWTTYIILRKLIFNDLEAGWPALVSILMIGFGITNISLGIIAEYLWRTLDSSRKRPVFIIDEIIELR